jgi:hypothetical protein
MTTTTPVHHENRPVAAGRVAVVERDGRCTGLVLEAGGRRSRVVIASRPDAALAHRLTGGLRRVRWVRITGSSHGWKAELVGASHRSPVRRAIPLAAALALAADGVPTLVTGTHVDAA